MKKIIIWISIIIIASNFTFGQKLFIKKAELQLDAKTKTEQEAVQIKSSNLDVNYINNQPEIVSKGKIRLSSLKTNHINLQDLISEYSSEEISFDMIFFTEQFQNRSNIEFSFNTVINLTINYITQEIPVTVIVSNSKTSQTNFYFINVNGSFSLSNFDVEIRFIEDDINFSYRQNVQVKN